MSKTNNTGGYAFPRPSVEITDNERNYGQSGMTLRDWFAGQALTGSLSNNCDGTVRSIAIEAYLLADAMIAAREEKL